MIETNEARNEAPKNKEQSRRDAASKEINELTILTKQISDETEDKINNKDTFGADILEIESDYDIERKNSIGKKKRDSTEGRKRKIQEDPSERIDKSNKVELLSRGNQSAFLSVVYITLKYDFYKSKMLLKFRRLSFLKFI